MPHELQIALQLYTIRDETARDFTAALGKVAGLGYKGVEFFDYGGIASSELRNILMNLDLKAVNTHISLERMEANADKEIKYASELGLKDLTIPRLPEDRRRSREDYIKFADTLEAIGARCSKEGIRLHFHNHYYEFDLFGDSRGMDIILENTSAVNLSIELDTFWVEYAGIDPVEYLKKNAARIEMIHLKDMIKLRCMMRKVNYSALIII